MSESEVLGRLSSPGAKLLEMTHQIKVILDYMKAGAAESKVSFACTWRSPIRDTLWGCVQSLLPVKQTNKKA